MTDTVCLSADDALLFVSDSGNHRVQIVRLSDGVVERTIGTGVAGDGANQLNNPGGICLSKDGALVFVADQCNRRVQVVRVLDGAIALTIGSRGNNDGQFQFPTRLCLSPSGKWLYVIDAYAGHIPVFRASTGEFVRNIDTRFPNSDGEMSFENHAGVCVTPGGDNLLAVSTSSHRVLVYLTA